MPRTRDNDIKMREKTNAMIEQSNQGNKQDVSRMIAEIWDEYFSAEQIGPGDLPILSVLRDISMDYQLSEYAALASDAIASIDEKMKQLNSGKEVFDLPEDASQANLMNQYRILHAEGEFKGHALQEFIPCIQELIVEWNAQSMLDFGSGKGLLHPDWGIPLRLYDPAVPGIETKPTGRFDLVICTDVLEHIEEPDIPDVLDDIFGYAERGVFLTICLRESVKLLPDGRNRHVTVKPKDWWLNKIGDQDVQMEIRWT